MLVPTIMLQRYFSSRAAQIERQIGIRKILNENNIS